LVSIMTGPAAFLQGQIFIGLILNVLLFGINVTQTYFYYIHSKRDQLWIKIWVVVIFVADFIQPLFCSIYLYRTLIVHFGDEATSSTANNMFAVVPTMTSLTASLVQIFFAWRIRILTNNWYYVAFVIAAAVSGGACSIVIAFVGLSHSRFVDFGAFKVVVIINFVSEMLADIMITSILVSFLHTHKSGFRQSDKMVDRIIRVTMQTGLLTLIFAILNMLLYLINVASGTYLISVFVTSKIYSSSFLSSLNSRQGWGYDVSENTGNLEFDLGTDLGLRFANNSTADRTSVVVTV